VEGKLRRASAPGPRVGAGFVVERNDLSALEVSAEERLRAYEIRWSAAAWFQCDVRGSADQQGRHDTAADFFRAKIRAAVRDPVVAETLSPRTTRWAPSASASTPTTTTRSTVTTSP